MKTLKCKTFVIRFVYCVIVMLIIIVGFFFPTVSASAEKRIDFHGIDITDYESIDVYRMKIPLGDIGKTHLGTNNANVIRPLIKAFKRVEATVLLMFIFPEIKAIDESTGEEDMIYITGRARCVLPSSVAFNVFSPSGAVEFAQTELVMSLSNNYYKYLESINADFSKVKISIGYDGKSAPLCTGVWCTQDTFSVNGISIYSEGVPPSVFDPESPDFDINEGNTGDNLMPEPKPETVQKGCGFDWNNFLKLPNWVLYTLFGLAVLFVVLVMFKLFT